MIHLRGNKMKTQAINEADLVSTAEHSAACHSTPQHTFVQFTVDYNAVEVELGET